MTSPLAPLTRDVGCRKDMMWATRLASSVSVAEFIAALERHGFQPGHGATIAGLEVFDHTGSGHRLIYVVRTGRIQLRLDALTRHEDRVGAARDLYEVLQRATHEVASAAATTTGRSD